MRDERIDRVTILGLLIALLLMVSYLIYDYIDKNHTDLSFLNPSIAVNMAVPAWRLPDLNMDWFYNMDPVSKLLFCFLMTVLIGTATGCSLLYLRYRRNKAKN